MDAKKIWSYARRLLAIIPSIFICALGVALLVWPEWGCDPLTTFEIGLSNVFHVQFGTVALVFEGIMFFVFFFVRRDLVHLGTLAWCFLIGPFENFWLDVLAPMLPTAPEMSVGLKIACILIGSIIIILTLAYYIPIGLGYQTSDIFAFMAADLVKKIRNRSDHILCNLICNRSGVRIVMGNRNIDRSCCIRTDHRQADGDY